MDTSINIRHLNDCRHKRQWNFASNFMKIYLQIIRKNSIFLLKLCFVSNQDRSNNVDKNRILIRSSDHMVHFIPQKCVHENISPSEKISLYQNT